MWTKASWGSGIGMGGEGGESFKAVVKMMICVIGSGDVFIVDDGAVNLDDIINEPIQR